MDFYLYVSVCMYVCNYVRISELLKSLMNKIVSYIYFILLFILLNFCGQGLLSLILHGLVSYGYDP